MDIVGDDLASFQPLLDDFEDNTLELIEKMMKAGVEADYEEVYRSAHQLKGSTGMLGLVKLYQACSGYREMPTSHFDEVFFTNVKSIAIESIEELKKTLRG